MHRPHAHVACAIVAAIVAVGLPVSAGWQSQAAPQKPGTATSADPQLPKFRAGAHFVRVDAYPSRDGRIIEGLTGDDFELLEDGAPQKIDSLEFIRFDAFTPDIERRDPNSQREAFQLASDPRYRLFVIYLDMYHVNLAGSHETRRLLTNMLDRLLGPSDLFGMLTPRQTPQDLILGQKTQMIEEQLSRHWTWGMEGQTEYEPGELELTSCGLGSLIPRRRLDKVFTDLEQLLALLGDLREERKNILLFSGGWLLPGRNDAVPAGNSFVAPPVGITNAGKLTLGAGRAGEPSALWCQQELNRLAGIDFQVRNRDLLRDARRANVTFYAVSPSGLEAPVTAAGQDVSRARMDSLITLANNTEGLAIVNTNALDAGLARVVNDLSAYYVLGYYTTNTKWDGQVRKITVRLKRSKETVRARREYRAPTEAEMAILRAAPATAPAGPSAVDVALAELSRLRPSAAMLTYCARSGGDLAVVAELAPSVVEAGRWKSGGELQVIVSDAAGTSIGSVKGRIEPGARAAVVRVPVAGHTGALTAVAQLRGSGEPDEYDRFAVPPATGTLIGAPLVHRALPAASSPLRPVAVFQFRRTERIHVEWPVLHALDNRTARLLGKDGRPLAVDIPLAESDRNGAPALVADLNLAPLTAGDYLIEVTAGAGAASERTLLAIRVVR